MGRAIIAVTIVNTLILAPVSAEQALETATGCFKHSRHFHEVRLQYGVATEKAIVSTPITTLKFPAGNDGTLYSECLERNNVNAPVARSAYWTRMDECRAAARRPTPFRIGARNAVSLSASHDGDRFNHCMEGKTVPGLDVEVELPETGADDQRR